MDTYRTVEIKNVGRKMIAGGHFYTRGIGDLDTKEGWRYEIE
jgi:hypothetical protein